jgi:hypothetical protein
MHEYQLTGRAETDKCLKLANKAHNYYFNNPLEYKLEFAKAAKEFFEAIEQKFLSKTNETRLLDAIKKYFKGNMSKIQFFSLDLLAIKDRLNIIINNPNLVDTKTVFVLDHTARFIEVIIPYICDVKEEVEHNKKFNYKSLMENELTFFDLPMNESRNDYLYAFYENCFRAQKNLNGFSFIRDHLNLSDEVVDRFYHKYGIRDYFSSLIFARMANEQFMKYLTFKHPKFWDNLKPCLDSRLSEEKMNEIISNKNVDDRLISMPSRIDALGKTGVLNELIVREAKLVQSRGNNIAHYGIPALYPSCYHNLEVLNYLNKYCK